MIIHVYDMFTRRQDRKAVEAVKDGEAWYLLKALAFGNHVAGSRHDARLMHRCHRSGYRQLPPDIPLSSSLAEVVVSQTVSSSQTTHARN